MLELANAFFRYRNHDANIFENLTLRVNISESVGIMGPSGCGKSTLLKAISGILTLQSGKITLNDQEITQRPAAVRGISLVFQDYALFDHMTAEKNIFLGFQMTRLPRSEKWSKVNRLIDKFGLSQEARRKASELSGGQKQRVALARALAASPQALLLDEPLSSLDEHLRITLRETIRLMIKEGSCPTVVVSHSFEDLAHVCDKIAFWKDRALTPPKRPADWIADPRSIRYARLMGLPNRIQGECFRRILARGGVSELELEQFKAPYYFLPFNSVALGTSKTSGATSESWVYVPSLASRVVYDRGYPFVLFSYGNVQIVCPVTEDIGKQVPLSTATVALNPSLAVPLSEQ